MFHLGGSKKYPLVKEGVEILPEAAEIGKDYVIGFLGDYAHDTLHKRQRSKSRHWEAAIDSFSNYLGSVGSAASRKIEARINENFPGIGAILDGLDGSSKIKYLITAESEGKEIPVYAGQTDKDPSDEEVQSNISFFQANRCSPYQIAETSLQLYRGEFDTPGLDFVTNEDSTTKMPDPKQERGWTTRIEMELIQQRGKIDKKYQKTINGVKLRKYIRPPKRYFLGLWSAVSAAYDLTDPLYSLAKVGKASVWTQTVSMDNYRAATGIVRAAIRNRRRHPMEFDFRTEDQKAQPLKQPGKSFETNIIDIRDLISYRQRRPRKAA